MIAVESFKPFRAIDFIAIIIMASMCALSIFLSEHLFNVQTAYFFSLLIMTTLLAFVVKLINKTGVALLFFLSVGILTFNLSVLGPVKANKLIVFFIVSIVFELVFLILKLEIENLQVDIIIGTSFASALIPFATALVISSSVAINLISQLINMMFIAFLIGIAGSLIASLIWFEFKATRLFVRFFYR